MIRRVFLLVLISLVAADGSEPSRAADYGIVVSKKTLADPHWKQVVQALRAKHGGQVMVYDAHVTQSLDALTAQLPRYACFVATADEATKDFVADVHQLTRKINDDPFTDVSWGILTGYDAASALQIAEESKPLTIRKVASGTEIAMEMVDEGVWYCELTKNRMVRKQLNGEATAEQGPDDTTKALVDTLNQYQADLFITSGHATQRDWQIGFRYRNGSFRSQAGQLTGHDTHGEVHPILSSNPKVYLPVGNCLMGQINGPDAMALAWMKSAGVRQMIGYTVPTWFGYAGWGCLDYFVEQPGRYTLAEAFLANHHALVYSIEHQLGNLRGLEFDRDVLAFYGDPAWPARMADRPKAYQQSLTEQGGVYTFTITGNRGVESFRPISTNGSQRGWRPIIQFLPHRIHDVQILEGSQLEPVVADDFILVPNPRQYDANREYVVRFRAKTG